MSWLESPFATRVLGWATLTAVLVMLGFAVFLIPDIASNTDASRRTDDLASCRAQYRSAVDDANVVLLDAFGDVQTGIANGVVAAIRQDPTTLALVAADLDAAEERKQEAVAGMVAASDAYRQAVDLSQTDPDLFLDQCKENAR